MAVKDEEIGVELVPADTAEGLARILAGLSEAEGSSETSIQDVKYQIVMEMLSAESETELWKELPAWSTKTSVGESFEIRDARAWRSKFEGEDGSKGAFLSCPAVNLATGELGILNTSAMRIAGRIGWYKLHGKLPFRATVVKRGETERGFDVLDLELLEA